MGGTGVESLYRPISVESLEPLKNLKAAIFLKNPSGNFVLYKGAEHSLNEADIARLHKNGTEYLYLRAGDAEEVNSAIEATLADLIADPEVPLSRKSAVLMQASSSFVAELFSQPSKAKDVVRCRKIVDSIVSFVISTPAALREISKVASHDYHVYVHSVRVAAYLVALHVRSYQVGRDALIDVGIGGLLHDFGLLFVPQQILNKPTALSRDELSIYRRHPEEGYRYLKGLGVFPEATLAIVRSHHERLDGKGYPQGLEGTGILRSVLVAAVCDAYVSRISNRLYQVGMDPEAALAELSAEGGSAYHPELLAGMSALLQELVAPQ